MGARTRESFFGLILDWDGNDREQRFTVGITIGPTDDDLAEIFTTPVSEMA